MQAHESVRGRRTATRTRKRTTTTPASRGRRVSVVLVEDDEDMRVVSSEVLRAAGFDVVECPTLMAAFVAVKGQVPEILLLDRELPDGSGLELARWVRRRPTFDGMKVIVFSGRKSAHDVDAALAAGCDSFIGKPCPAATLLAEIAATASLRQRRGA